MVCTYTCIHNTIHHTIKISTTLKFIVLMGLIYGILTPRNQYYLKYRERLVDYLKRGNFRGKKFHEFHYTKKFKGKNFHGQIKFSFITLNHARISPYGIVPSVQETNNRFNPFTVTIKKASQLVQDQQLGMWLERFRP